MLSFEFENAVLLVTFGVKHGAFWFRSGTAVLLAWRQEQRPMALASVHMIVACDPLLHVGGEL